MTGPRARTRSVADFSGRARVFTVHAAIEDGRPLRTLMGTPMESWPPRRDRIHAALTHCGLTWPDGQIDIMTSPNTINAHQASDQAIGSLPSVYRRDRGVALSGKAAALAALREPGEAAATAIEALDVARSAGSERIVRMVVPVAEAVATHQSDRSVARLLALLREPTGI